jgi:hypothetical protein
VSPRRIAVSVVDIDPPLPEPDALAAHIAALHFKNKKSISFSTAIAAVSSQTLRRSLIAIAPMLQKD